MNIIKDVQTIISRLGSNSIKGLDTELIARLKENNIEIQRIEMRILPIDANLEKQLNESTKRLEQY